MEIVSVGAFSTIFTHSTPHHHVLGLIMTYSSRSTRLWASGVLSVIWLYGLFRWWGHPNGAGAILLALLGWVALGTVGWVAPIEDRMLRVFARVLGALVALAALALYVFLVMLLRNGL